MDMNKFSFAQMTSNSDGKTSASGTAGSLCVSVGVFCFVVGCIFYWIFKDSQIMTQSLMLISAGSALLAYRKSRPDPAAVADPEPVEGNINESPKI